MDNKPTVLRLHISEFYVYVEKSTVFASPLVTYIA